MAIIELKDVCFTYTGRKAETLQHVSLRIEEGETVLLLGASGSGKSTLALCLNRLIPQTLSGAFCGKVSIAGYDTTSTSVAELAQHVGIVFQDPEAQCIMMNVEDEVAFGLENLCLPSEETHERIGTALGQVRMVERRNARIDHLSGGGKQRLTIASLLAMRPHTLIFDEPTANLDPVGTRDIFAAIQDLKRTGNYTIVLIEHKLDAPIHLIDRVIVLAPGGKILIEGSPRAVFRDHTATLLEYGIWMPQVALLAHHLRERGWRWEPFPITLDEAARAWEPAQRELVPHIPLPRSMSPQSSLSPVSPSLQESAVEIHHLSFFAGTQKILDDLSLCVPRGDFLAIVGANGAGKTTLAHHLINIIHAPRGCVWLYGQDVTRLSAHELRKRVGYVFQNPEHQFIANTVEEEVRFGLRLQHLSAAELEQRVKQILEQFGLGRYAQANPFTLSHGEKRRLSVATMLVSGQQLLILDEPTFGQDQRNATGLLELLRALNAKGCTIIIITHDMALVAEYARHVAVLAAGRLLYHGPTAHLFAQPALLQQGHLELPPLAELSHRLAAACNPAWSDLLTLDQFLQTASLLMGAQAS